MIPFPDKKYSVIYADPPWSYSGGGAKRNVTRHYHTMKAKDIYDLPVQDIAADDCLLFMWATFPNLEVALETIRRWGFQYKTAAFVWVKRNRKSPGWFWGLGNWTRANPEVCLLATKGKPIRALVWYKCAAGNGDGTICNPKRWIDCDMGGKEDRCPFRHKKPEGVAVELADAVIRIADLCGYLGIDLDTVISEKMAYNETRPFKHGKRF